MGFLQLASDNFIRSSYPENPLSQGGNWTADYRVDTPFEVASAGVVECTTGSAWTSAIFTGISLPNDQYSQITIGNCSNPAQFIAFIRESTSWITNCYLLYMVTGQLATVETRVGGVNTTIFSCAASGGQSAMVASGDVWMIAAQGEALTVYQNGVLVGSGTASDLSSGNAGLVLYANTPTNGTFAAWSGGEVGTFNYTVSGNVGIAGVNVSYTGISSGSTVSASDGSYSFSLPNGTYYVNPILSGYFFTPQTRTVTVSGTAVSDVNFTSYASPGTHFGVWTPQGIVIPQGATALGNPNVFYESNPHILPANPDGNIFKILYGVNGLNYAESSDGRSWTFYTAGSGNPVIPVTSGGYARVYKHANTYYCYLTATDKHSIAVYTSSDEVTWVSQGTAYTSSQAWEGNDIWQLNVVDVVAGTWYGYYTAAGNWYMGLATSSNGLGWTPDAGNPAISVNTSNFEWHKIGGAYYGWSQAFVGGTWAACLGRFSATSPSGPWIELSNATYHASQPAELQSISTLDLPGDPSLVEANGNTYLYYTVTDDVGNAHGIAAAIAYGTTLAQLVASHEGGVNVPYPLGSLDLNTLASDSFSANDIANWTQLSSASGWGAAQITGNTMEAATVVNADSWWNACTWLPDQWSRITVAACAGSSIGVSLRQNTSGTATSYRLYWTGTLGSAGTYYIDKEISGISTNLFSGALTVSTNDVLLGVAIGTNIYFYQNAFLVMAVSDSSIANGAAGVLLAPASAIANAQISAWSGGNFNNQYNGVSGALGANGAGAMVSWSGSSSGSTTADGYGNFNTGENLYSFGTYTITPSKAGYTFSPTSSVQTVSGADITGVNFTATQNPTSNGGAWFLSDQVSFLENIPRR